MGCLKVVFGTMNSAKSATLLMLAHAKMQCGFTVKILKSSLDTRSTQGTVHSRIGLEKSCDLLVGPEDHITPEDVLPADYIFVDECQFLTIAQVEDLRRLPVPVLCYGLKSDYRLELFPASKRLLELADSVRELKTICSSGGCHRRATITAKLSQDGTLVTKGSPVPDIGDIGKYRVFCWHCYRARVGEEFLRVRLPNDR